MSDGYIQTDYEAVDWIAHHAAATPDKTAMIELPSGRRLSYAQVDNRVGRLAAHLKHIGIRQGDRVGFLALNTTDILELAFATWRLGGIVLALNFRLTASELEFIVEDSSPRVIIHDGALPEVLAELQQRTSVDHWIETKGDGSDSAYERAIADAPASIDERTPQPLNAQCMLMYSSGTTGKPKGVIITHGMLAFSATAGAGPGNNSRSSVSLAVMPLFHIAAMNVSCLPALFIGATTVVMRSFEPGAVLAAIGDQALGVTHFFAVPSAFNVLRQHPDAETTDFSRLVIAVSGAETVPPPLVSWWAERGVVLQEGYGLTETAGQGCLLASEDVARKPGSAGKPLMHSRMKIMKDEHTEARDGETGEIWMRGAVVTPGYWGRPEATEDAFSGGWFKTGDIGTRDAEGYFYIEDRLKDMYISGGENVYPAEIEGVLYGIDAIAEVAVIGVFDEQWGEIGCAVVALKPGFELELAELIDHCEDRLAKYKHPAHLTIVEALPRNATGKVLKFELRQTIPQQLGLKS
ncbi:long-chain fatty acid--CoA ligase [Hoeflea sp. TYP-13]|uniref:long-chain fatty acid--CoA ligase n=1 Tax=Hoeflea sp. TYP-13 TaxID=3230023 RepID=UPI0034C5F1A5